MAGNLGDGFYHQGFDEGVGLFDIDMLLFGGVPGNYFLGVLMVMMLIWWWCGGGGGGGPLYNGANIYGLHPDLDMDPNVEEEDEQLVQDNHKWQFVRDYPR
uniref:Uncharacterized protein n=1 Tax=Oryza glumipatula TaxID=40148 RepID=A0A0E0BSZ6_9ORYZ